MARPTPAKGATPVQSANGHRPSRAARVPVKSTGTGQERRTIVVDGPDPMASRWWDGLAERTMLELSGRGAPASIRVGMKGSPERTFYGWGNAQATAIAYAARNAFPAENAGQALPAASAPVGAADFGPKSLVAQFGL
jgi:hypothetical protein